MMDQRIKTDMTDWCGNPVCVGDNVLFVSTLKPRIFNNFSYKDPETGELCSLRVIPRTPQYYAWVVAHVSEVIMFEGKPHITAPKPAAGPGDFSTMIVPVDLFWDMYCDQTVSTGNIFAIEGVSDNHEKFFKYYFNKNLRNKN